MGVRFGSREGVKPNPVRPNAIPDYQRRCNEDACGCAKERSGGHRLYARCSLTVPPSDPSSNRREYREHEGQMEVLATA